MISSLIIHFWNLYASQNVFCWLCLPPPTPLHCEVEAPEPLFHLSFKVLAMELGTVHALPLRFPHFKPEIGVRNKGSRDVPTCTPHGCSQYDFSREKNEVLTEWTEGDWHNSLSGAKPVVTAYNSTWISYVFRRSFAVFLTCFSRKLEHIQRTLDANRCFNTGCCCHSGS